MVVIISKLVLGRAMMRLVSVVFAGCLCLCLSGCGREAPREKPSIVVSNNLRKQVVVDEHAGVENEEEKGMFPSYAEELHVPVIPLIAKRLDMLRDREHENAMDIIQAEALGKTGDGGVETVKSGDDIAEEEEEEDDYHQIINSDIPQDEHLEEKNGINDEKDDDQLTAIRTDEKDNSDADPQADLAKSSTKNSQENAKQDSIVSSKERNSIIDKKGDWKKYIFPTLGALAAVAIMSQAPKLFGPFPPSGPNPAALNSIFVNNSATTGTNINMGTNSSLSNEALSHSRSVNSNIHLQEETFIDKITRFLNHSKFAWRVRSSRKKIALFLNNMGDVLAQVGPNTG